MIIPTAPLDQPVNRALARALAERHLQEVRADPTWAGALTEATFVFFGSWVSGFGDQYSDIDLLAVLDDDRYERLYEQRARAGLPRGQSLLDIRCYQLKSVCKIKSVATLRRELREDLVVAVWLYTHAELLSTDRVGFLRLRDAAQKAFTATRSQLLATEFVRVRRWLDWIENFARRGYPQSLELVRATFTRGALRCASLAAGLPYPHDKWLFPWVARRVPGADRLAQALASLLTLRGAAAVVPAAQAGFAELVAYVERIVGPADWLSQPGRYIVEA